MTPSGMSKLKSKTRRTSCLTSSTWCLWANSWRMATPSEKTISRKSPPHTGYIFCREASLSPPSASSPRRWSACTPHCQLLQGVQPHQPPAPQEAEIRPLHHLLGWQECLLSKALDPGLQQSFRFVEFSFISKVGLVISNHLFSLINPFGILIHSLYLSQSSYLNIKPLVSFQAPPSASMEFSLWYNHKGLIKVYIS